MGVDRKAIFMMFAIIGPVTLNVNAPASAEEIYKSVNQAGQVTYAAAPLADAVTMKTVAPPHQPTPEEVCAAEEQYQLIKTFGAELEQNRKQREEDLAQKVAEERAQQYAGRLAVVYLPVPVFVGPVHPLSHFKPRRPLARTPARGQM